MSSLVSAAPQRAYEFKPIDNVCRSKQSRRIAS